MDEAASRMSLAAKRLPDLLQELLRDRRKGLVLVPNQKQLCFQPRRQRTKREPAGSRSVDQMLKGEQIAEFFFHEHRSVVSKPERSFQSKLGAALPAPAGYVADALDADVWQITAETPYTAGDLNYSDASSRATREQNDPSARPGVSGSVGNMAAYDVIFLGYPIWWGQAPKIMYTFVESYDLSGKTIIPFCTSGSSGIGSSAANLSSGAAGASWLAGNRFSGSASRDTVTSWLQDLVY